MERRFKAFLSYSHKDEAFARWLHGALERWRVPGDLKGREARFGPVPPNLRPVFLDREDFSGGDALQETTRRVLDASDALIVVCSPSAAASRYVGEEIRYFKSLGRTERIVPVIVSGEPGDPEQGCFPEALIHTVDALGRQTLEGVDVIAADARASGDGRSRALSKVIAGLLGLPLDEIVRREERARRRRLAVAGGAGAGAAVFATVFSAYALYQSHEARLAIDRSVFALGTMIDRVDGLRLSGADDAARVEMLRVSCDLFQGLTAETSRTPEPDTLGVCVSEQAIALKQAGEVKPAVELAARAQRRWRLAYESRPDVPLAKAYLRTTRLRWQLADEAAGASGSDALMNEWVGVAATLARDHPQESGLRAQYEEASWMLIKRHEGANDWAASRQHMRSALALHDQLLEVLGPLDGREVAVDRGTYLRRLGWLEMTRFKNPAGAAALAAQAVDQFESLERRPEDLAWYRQSAVALRVLADALRASGQAGAARGPYQRAVDRLRELKQAPGVPVAELGDIDEAIRELSSRIAEVSP